MQPIGVLPGRLNIANIDTVPPLLALPLILRLLHLCCFDLHNNNRTVSSNSKAFRTRYCLLVQGRFGTLLRAAKNQVSPVYIPGLRK
jgi:hypothetical protein